MTESSLVSEPAAAHSAEDVGSQFVPVGDFDDDRAGLRQGDRAVLIIRDDAGFARAALDIGRERHFKGLVALDAGTGLAMARLFEPDAIILALTHAGIHGLAVLDNLKHNSATRHIPVHFVSPPDQRQHALNAGAVAHYNTPLTRKALHAIYARISRDLARGSKRLLLVDDDEGARKAIGELIGAGDDDVVVVPVSTAEEAFLQLETTRFDCMVLDLKLPAMSGFKLIDKLKEDDRLRELPVIIYTGKELTRKEETALRKHAETIIVKGVDSPERLLEETSLFLHRADGNLPEEQRSILDRIRGENAVLAGKKILIVDDDVRNVFALTSALEVCGIQVLFAENGKDGIETLTRNPDVDLVLMDIMMPEMDGYETIRQMRGASRFETLPIIALTAKAMKGDREKSIAAGASDYIAKPIETEQLLSLLRVWLQSATPLEG